MVLSAAKKFVYATYDSSSHIEEWTSLLSGGVGMQLNRATGNIHFMWLYNGEIHSKDL